MVVSTLAMKLIVIDLFPRKGIVGIDYHKNDKRKLPQMGGISMLLGIITSTMVLQLTGVLNNEVLAFVLSVSIAGLVGVVDGIFKLKSHTKTALTLLPAIPIVFLQAYTGIIRLPFNIRFMIPLIYLGLIPVALAVTSNAINMFDPLNGAASGTSLIAMGALLICSLIGFAIGTFHGNVTTAAMIFAIMFPSAVVLFMYNKYPSRVFIGDVGTLSLGASIGAYAIINGLEIPGVVAIMLQITNSFFILSSVGRLFEHSEIKKRPIVVTPDERILANPDTEAPITLTRFMAILGYDKEKNIVSAYYLMALFCAMLSVVVMFFMG
jgi:UDP-N-acetylglucosamine--dolichyl-phosphate N-acetylglucosaminephosphotransferase